MNTRVVLRADMAKRFIFRLQRLLDYRKMLEENKKQEYILAQREVILQSNKIEVLVNEQKLHIEDSARYKVGNVNSTNLRLAEGYIIALNKKANYEREILQQLETTKDEKKQEFIEARKQALLLERLKEKKLKEYKYEVDKEEQKFLDEIGSIAYVNNMSHD